MIEDEVCNNSKFGCALVGLKEFHIGSLPPRILDISCTPIANNAVVTGEEILLQMEVTFKSNASISLDWCPIPVTVRNIEASNMKLGVILKRLFPYPPFIGELDIFLREELDITWDTAGMARVTDIPGIEQLVDYLIEEKIRGQLVPPNCISSKLD